VNTSYDVQSNAMLNTLISSVNQWSRRTGGRCVSVFQDSDGLYYAVVESEEKQPQTTA
jgi:hypothetical protein